MSRRRGLGRGLGALIPAGGTVARGDRPVDIFFPGYEHARIADDTESAAGGSQPDATAAGESAADKARLAADAEWAEGAAVDVRAEGSGAAVTPPDLNDAEPHQESSQAAGTENDTRPSNGGATAPEGPAAAEGAPASSDVSRETAPARVRPPGDDAHSAAPLLPVPGARFLEVAIDQLVPNPRQPRQVFDSDELVELAASIREVGVLQPVVVRERPGADGGGAGPWYELIMGERRWRASQLAGLDSVPAIVRDTADDDLLRDALLENLHRSQLNVLEEAAAYSQLLDDFGCTQDELARRIGRSRPQISNTIRLLRLPPQVQRRVAAGVLTAGHARALLALDDPAEIERLATRVVAEGMSVRAVEEIVTLGGSVAAAPSARRLRPGGRHPQLDEVSARLSDRLDTRVTITLGRRKGRLSVDFASIEDLDRILAVLDAPGDDATPVDDVTPFDAP